MRPFTKHSFKEADGVIPNLHPDFKFEIVEQAQTWSDRTTKRHIYSVKGSAITSSSTLSVHNNEWYELFSCDKNGGYVNFNIEIAKSAGLVGNRCSWDGWEGCMDAIYYKSNPMIPYTVTNKLRKAVWSQLKRRCNVDKWACSTASVELLNLVVADMQLRDPLLSSEDVNVLLRDKGLNTFVCALSAQIASSYYKNRALFSDGRKDYHCSISLPYLGFHEDRDPLLGHVWLKEFEIIIHGAIFNRNDVVMGICPVCNNEFPEQLITDGECIKCSANRYKIHNYSAKAPDLLTFKAKKVMPSTIYLGIELEYETPNRDIARVAVGKALRGHAIMKSDGSIRNGFEIVTCPATLEIHLEEFKKFFSTFPAELSKSKNTMIFPDDNTGMHVHVSRKPLSMLTIGKMTSFLNRKSNKEFIAYIAGRIDNHFARMDTSRTVTFPLMGNGDRYNALNLQNSATVEFRIFSTPKNWSEFASRLEFCQALTDYCQPCQVSGPLSQLSEHTSFINWLKDKRKLFPELTSHLKGYVCA
jgi:hypothetical protein